MAVLASTALVVSVPITTADKPAKRKYLHLSRQCKRGRRMNSTLIINLDKEEVPKGGQTKGEPEHSLCIEAGGKMLNMPSKSSDWGMLKRSLPHESPRR